ncbi:uncharacterized protein E0L32_005204 [Thyridium curvatum]|uniref:FAR1 domain-containing protein n=1 Tax=Thyridium curvatum TaxID=1093900 RepID=A0A507BBP7_9PEZI|nr:uncharacterized protein E0L32_005204 [Thyridium curvatum]TPX14809.1 hypothetical protein E0L32_005204 [Thyridium curvatum]
MWGIGWLAISPNYGECVLRHQHQPQALRHQKWDFWNNDLRLEPRTVRRQTSHTVFPSHPNIQLHQTLDPASTSLAHDDNKLASSSCSRAPGCLLPLITETTDHVLYPSAIPSPGHPAGQAVPNPPITVSHPAILTPASSSAITPIHSPALASVPSVNGPQAWGLTAQGQVNPQAPAPPAAVQPHHQQQQQQPHTSSSSAMMPNGTPTRNNAAAPSASSTPAGAPISGSPATHALAPPPEGVFGTFDDLLNTVQRAAKDSGYGVVKLRASNYRDGKATRYDLVCDRGGVKYSSTAKKRTPSTRKVDCPFRAKAVCEVQLGNKWRFVVQDGRHNHEARVPAAAPGQENTPLAQSLRSLTNKIDRMSHDMSQGFEKLDNRFGNLEKRMDALDAVMSARLGLAGMGAPPPGMPNGVGGPGPGGMPGDPSGVMDSRLNGMEARMSAMEQRMGSGMNGMEMPMDDVETRLLSSTVM